MDWQESELDLVNLLDDCFGFGGKVVTDLSMQYADIDVMDARMHSYSVKLQESSSKTGNFAFETKLESTSDGRIIDGSFTKCQADYYTIFRTFNNVKWCFLCDTNKLKHFINTNTYPNVTTRTQTELINNTGRKFNRGHCTLVPVKDLYYEDWVTVFHKPKDSWKLHMKRKGK